MAIARATGDDSTVAKVLAWAESTVDPFTYADPMGIGGELAAIAARAHDPRLTSWATYVELVGAWQRGDRTRIVHALDRLRDLAAAHRDVELAFRVRRTEADLFLLDGDIDRADHRADELLHDALGSDLRNLVLFASSLFYDVRRLQGRLPELLPWFDRVTARGERIPKVAAMRVEVLHAAGRDDEARSDLVAMVAGGFRDIAPPEQPHSFATLANVAGDARRRQRGWGAPRGAATVGRPHRVRRHGRSARPRRRLHRKAVSPDRRRRYEQVIVSRASGA